MTPTVYNPLTSVSQFHKSIVQLGSKGKDDGSRSSSSKCKRGENNSHKLLHQSM